MKELIERLRHYSPKNNFGICLEAADAIERLTAERDALQYQLNASQQHESKLEDLEKERDAWQQNCNDQIDLMNSIASERDAYKTSLDAAKAEVFRLIAERDALAKDTGKPKCKECAKWRQDAQDNAEWVSGVAQGRKIVEAMARAAIAKEKQA